MNAPMSDLEMILNFIYGTRPSAYRKFWFALHNIISLLFLEPALLFAYVGVLGFAKSFGLIACHYSKIHALCHS
jgi:hypothetical protein